MWQDEGYIESGGLRLHYLERGRGKPVLLLHGFGETANVWDYLLPYLVGPFRLLALDQRGHGLSDHAPEGCYSTLRFVSDIEALVQVLDLKGLTLVGHSMGGRNALVYAALHPQGVERLVVIDYGPELAPEGRRRIVKALRSRDDYFELQQMAQALMEENPRLDLKRAQEYLLKISKPLEDGRYRWRCDLKLLRAVREGKRVLRDVDLWQFVHWVRCPTLLLRGAESDLLRPEDAQKMAQAMADCRLVEIPHAGHAVPLDNPEATARAIKDFVTT